MAKTNSYGERDLKGSKRLKQAAMLIIGITFLVYCTSVLAAEGAPRILGTVIASGDASMKAVLDRWLALNEQTHPVVDGSAFKTAEGTTSMRMKDGATFEMGKKTDFAVNGAVGNYFAKLNTGIITFKIYQGMGLTVTTPSTSVVVQRVAGAVENVRHSVKDEISGIITYDGKETYVYCSRGKFSVMRANADALLLTEGNRTAVGDPLAATQAQVQASDAAMRTATPKVVFYESPNANASPGSSNTSVILLQKVETGGLEVSSENRP